MGQVRARAGQRSDFGSKTTAAAPLKNCRLLAASGVLSVLGLSTCSGLAAVYQERVMKGRVNTNIQACHRGPASCLDFTGPEQGRSQVGKPWGKLS